MQLSLTSAVLLSLGLSLSACGDDKPKAASGASGASGGASGAKTGGASGGGTKSGGSAGDGAGGMGPNMSAGSPSEADAGDGPTTPPGSRPTPMPLISRNVPAFASSADPNALASNANDGKNQSAWLSTAMPAWLAYDLSGVPADQRKRVLVAWYDGAALDFINPEPQESKHWPIDYTIELNSAAGGGDPPSDGWKTVETVTGNDRNTRQRLLDLDGANWVRMNITKSSSPTAVGLDLDVHSAPDGASDSWLLMGDSITFISTSYLFSDLPSLVHDRAPERWPAIIPAAIGGTNTTTALDALEPTLAGYPGRFVVLAYGTNDHTSEFHMEELVQKVIAAGKVPVVPRMPWSSSPNILQNDGPGNNAIIDALYDKYPEILRGPDFWNFFMNRTDLISDGDVHPNEMGQEELRKQWAIAMTK
jgi:hypothetical protein